MILWLVQFFVGSLGLWFAYRVGYEKGREEGYEAARKWSW